jgi:hypothetical protein
MFVAPTTKQNNQPDGDVSGSRIGTDSRTASRRGCSGGVTKTPYRFGPRVTRKKRGLTEAGL